MWHAARAEIGKGARTTSRASRDARHLVRTLADLGRAESEALKLARCGSRSRSRRYQHGRQKERDQEEKQRAKAAKLAKLQQRDREATPSTTAMGEKEAKPKRGSRDSTGPTVAGEKDAPIVSTVATDTGSLEPVPVPT